MRRMYSENQLIALIEQYGGSVSPEDIQKMFDDGDVDLAGMYVRIMDAPESTTLTDEQIAQIIEGCFIKGTFLGRKNPVLFPANITTGQEAYGYEGVIISKNSSNRYSYIGLYTINTTNKKIALGNDKLLQLEDIAFFNGKSIPNYPSSTGTFTLKCVNGVLTWIADAE